MVICKFSSMYVSGDQGVSIQRAVPCLLVTSVINTSHLDVSRAPRDHRRTPVPRQIHCALLVLFYQT